jgi:hypothetical protein
MTSDRPTDGFPGEVTGTVRAGGYALEPAVETGTRIVILDARARASSTAVGAALARPHQALGEMREAPVSPEEAIELAERATSWLERAGSLVRPVLAGNPLDRNLLEAEARAGLALLERLDRHHRLRDVLRVSRVLVALLLLLLRWAELVRVLRTALRAARELGDAASEAWVDHELGTLALAGGDVEQAAARLERARELRDGLDDDPGREATDANLRVLRALVPRRRGHRDGSMRRLALAGAGVAVIAAAVALVVALQGGSPKPTTTPASTPNASDSSPDDGQRGDDGRGGDGRGGDDEGNGPDLVDVDGDGASQPDDCNDEDPSIRPGADDTPGDGIDQDCDGADAFDADGDGDGASRPDDCNDEDASIHPGADDTPGDGIDQDCDGADAFAEP